MPNKTKNTETEKTVEKVDMVNTTTKEKVKTFYVPNLAGDRYARTNVAPLWATSSKSSSKYTSEQVKALLANPEANEKKLKEVSNYLWRTSSTYQNIVLYMSMAMTFDYALYPDKDIASLQQKSLINKFLGVARTASQLQIKSNFPIMLMNSLLYGDVYYYEISDEKNTIYSRLDSNACRLAYVDSNNIWRYFVDLTLVTPLNAYTFPDEVIKAYEKWIHKDNKNGKKSKKKRNRIIDGEQVEVPDNYYLVSEKGTAIFAHMSNTPKDYPYFASMFPDLLEHENNKTYFNDILKEQNIKVIHLKVPIDKETGEPLIDDDFVRAYHETAKGQLPKNQAPMTNPFDVTSIDTSGTQQNGINLVEHSAKVVQADSGISSTMFDASTTNGLKYSVLADITKMYPLQYFFTNITNRRIKDTGFKVTFLKVNYYNVEEWHKIYSADMLSGGNRFLFLSTTGLEPYEYIRLAQLEMAMDLESLFPVKMNASQMSGDDIEGGRPAISNEDDKSDSTIKVEETQ